MNEICGATTKAGTTFTFRCERDHGHSGNHGGWNVGPTRYKYTSWEQAPAPEPKKEYCAAANGPWQCTLAPGHPGGHRATDTKGGKGQVFCTWPQREFKPEYADWFQQEWTGVVEAARYPEPKPKEHPVLLTAEDLKTLAYYLPEYSGDADDQDDVTKAKIDKALKAAL